MIRMRWPFQSSKVLNKAVNSGRVLMGDIHLSNFAHNLTNGVFNVRDHDLHNTVAKTPIRRMNRGQLDLAVIEATEILEDGSIVPGGAAGIIPEIADIADKVIIEVNTKLPSFYGWHDIVPELCPPFRTPFLISRADDRIGQPYVKIDPAKVVAVVESTRPDSGQKMKGGDDDGGDAVAPIAQHISDFFSNEVRVGRLPARLLPLQSGIGNIANAVIKGLVDGPFHDVQVWSEVRCISSVQSY